MFKCQLGKHLSEPNEPQVRLVVESRPMIYKDTNGREIGKGKEIVRTIVSCPDCANDSPLERV